MGVHPSSIAETGSAGQGAGIGAGRMTKPLDRPSDWAGIVGSGETRAEPILFTGLSPSYSQRIFGCPVPREKRRSPALMNIGLPHFGTKVC